MKQSSGGGGDDKEVALKWTRTSDTSVEPTPAAYLVGSAELVSVGWLCRRDGNLLGVRTRGRDKFYLPGGKLEPGESPEQALIREVREELGVTLTNLQSAFTVTAAAHGQPAPVRLTMHCYHASSTGTPHPQREIEEVAWLTIPDDPSAAPAVQVVLQRLLLSE